MVHDMAIKPIYEDVETWIHAAKANEEDSAPQGRWTEAAERSARSAASSAKSALRSARWALSAGAIAAFALLLCVFGAYLLS
jgi:sensor domain CHASE-containing protein